MASRLFLLTYLYRLSYENLLNAIVFAFFFFVLFVIFIFVENLFENFLFTFTTHQSIVKVTFLDYFTIFFLWNQTLSPRYSCRRVTRILFVFCALCTVFCAMKFVLCALCIDVVG